jgi:hypothetical protein
MAGAGPRAELVCVTGVFVIQDGVKVVHFFHACFDEASNGAGAGDAVLAVALDAGPFVVEGGAVIREVLHEVGRQFLGDEFRGKGGIGGSVRLQATEVEVHGGEEIAVRGASRRRELICKAGLVLIISKGGAGDGALI